MNELNVAFVLVTGREIQTIGGMIHEKDAMKAVRHPLELFGSHFDILSFFEIEMEIEYGTDLSA